MLRMCRFILVFFLIFEVLLFHIYVCWTAWNCLPRQEALSYFTFSKFIVFALSGLQSSPGTRCILKGLDSTGRIQARTCMTQMRGIESNQSKSNWRQHSMKKWHASTVWVNGLNGNHLLKGWNQMKDLITRVLAIYSFYSDNALNFVDILSCSYLFDHALGLNLIAI